MKNMLTELKVRKSIEINSDSKKIWEALTNPNLTKKYFFGCEVESDWKIGSPILFIEKREGAETIHVKGKILNIKPEEFLEFTAWGPDSGVEDLESNYTIVSYNLYEKNNMTEIIISHENFGGDEKRFENSERGWSYLLTALKEFLENP